MSVDKLFQGINHQAVRDLFNSDGAGALFLVDLGKPAVGNTAGIKADGSMANGDYTIAGQPDVPRTLKVTVTRASADDTMGLITFRGTDAAGNELVEVFAPAANTNKQTANAFKTVTKITQSDWVMDTAPDQIQIGLGDKLGMPFILKSKNDVVGGHLNHAASAATVTVGNPPTLGESLVDMSAGTYSTSKEAQVMVRLSI